MIAEPASRWILIGNSGSGKSTLADRVGVSLNLPVYDLDLIHWHADGRKRDEVDRVERENRALIAERFPKLNRSHPGYDLAHTERREVAARFWFRVAQRSLCRQSGRDDRIELRPCTRVAGECATDARMLVFARPVVDGSQEEVEFEVGLRADTLLPEASRLVRVRGVLSRGAASRTWRAAARAMPRSPLRPRPRPTCASRPRTGLPPRP